MRTRCTSSMCSRADDVSEPSCVRCSTTHADVRCIHSSQTSIASPHSILPGSMRLPMQPPSSPMCGISSRSLRASSIFTTSAAAPSTMPPENSRRSAASVSPGPPVSIPAASSSAYVPASRSPCRMVSPVMYGIRVQRPDGSRTLRRIAICVFPTVPSACAMGCSARNRISILWRSITWHPLEQPCAARLLRAHAPSNIPTRFRAVRSTTWGPRPSRRQARSRC